uniref:Uncharacterized protein n=1 Tax=Myoviridae sp. ct0jJ30 TaxID=2825014 RepID=A0A8S5PHX1_9CAUD|nr:MAG TPA: hypothetical protein [Myoviridae sp. ct0jJ30]
MEALRNLLLPHGMNGELMITHLIRQLILRKSL